MATELDELDGGVKQLHDGQRVASNSVASIRVSYLMLLSHVLEDSSWMERQSTHFAFLHFDSLHFI
jgi:hypothetical protein